MVTKPECVASPRTIAQSANATEVRAKKHATLATLSMNRFRRCNTARRARNESRAGFQPARPILCEGLNRFAVCAILRAALYRTRQLRCLSNVMKRKFVIASVFVAVVAGVLYSASVYNKNKTATQQNHSLVVTQDGKTIVQLPPRNDFTVVAHFNPTNTAPNSKATR